MGPPSFISSLGCFPTILSMELFRELVKIQILGYHSDPLKYNPYKRLQSIQGTLRRMDFWGAWERHCDQLQQAVDRAGGLGGHFEKHCSDS